MTKEQIDDGALKARNDLQKDPIAFMLNCVIRIQMSSSKDYGRGGKTTVALKPGGEDYPATKFHGTTIPLYFLVPGEQVGKGRFNVYWCPYKEDSIKAITLWKDCDFMFTELMTGCTFGVGSQGGTGAVRVAHVNQMHLQTQDSTTQMEQKQAELARSELGNEASLLQPEQYRRKFGENADLSSVTFGVRDDKVWSFYAQQTESTGSGTYVLRGLKKFA